MEGTLSWMNNNLCARHCLHALSPLILQTALWCYYYPHYIDEETGSGIILKSKSELVTSLAHRFSVARCFLLAPFQLLHNLLWLNSPASSLHIPQLNSQRYLSTALNQPPVSKPLQMLSLLSGSFFLLTTYPFFKSLTLSGRVVGSL